MTTALSPLRRRSQRTLRARRPAPSPGGRRPCRRTGQASPSIRLQRPRRTHPLTSRLRSSTGDADVTRTATWPGLDAIVCAIVLMVLASAASASTIRRKPATASAFAASTSASKTASLAPASFSLRRSSLLSPWSRSIACGSSPAPVESSRTAVAHGVAQHPVRPQRAAAAFELQTRAAAKALPPEIAMTPIAPVRRDVRAAAGGDVEAVDVDDAQRAGADRVLAQGQRGGLRRVDEPDGDRSIGPDHVVGGLAPRPRSPPWSARARGRSSPCRRQDGSSRCAHRQTRSMAADSTCWPVCCCM